MVMINELCRLMTDRADKYNLHCWFRFDVRKDIIYIKLMNPVELTEKTYAVVIPEMLDGGPSFVVNVIMEDAIFNLY
jgi:hypothetical protein